MSRYRKLTESGTSPFDALRVFVDNPMVPLDNNDSERALRGVVVGRKIITAQGQSVAPKVAAILYSIMETAKRNGLNPEEWVVQAIKEMRDSPGVVPLPLAKK